MACSGEDDAFRGVELPPAPAAATSSAISTSDAAATVAKLLSTIKAVEKNAKFKTDTAATFIEKKDFEGLEAYVVQTLTFVQGTEQHHHPGILCSLYQAQIYYLVKEGRIGDAETVLNEKVKPLLDNGDKFYRPKNLEDQVRKVEKCISRLELPEDIHILSLLLDYFGLYFPSSLTPNIKRTASVLDFVVKRDVDGVQETRCLACQWVVPHGLSEGELTKHYTGDGHVECCFHVTEWMFSFLNTIKTKVGAGYVRNLFEVEATGKSPDKRKRKTAPLLSDDNFIMTELLIDGILDVQTSICKLPFYLVKEEELRAKAYASKVRMTLLDMLKVTSDLISLAFRSITLYDTFDPFVTISKFTALAISAEDLRVPLLCLQHSKSAVQELYCMVANVKNIVVLADVTGMKKSKVALSAEGSNACAGSTVTPTS